MSSGPKRSPRGVNKEGRNYSNAAKNAGLDVDALHEFLWKKSNRFGILLVSQSDVARELDLNLMALSRVFRQMSLQGRLRQSSMGLNKWQIADPELWKSLQ